MSLTLRISHGCHVRITGRSQVKCIKLCVFCAMMPDISQNLSLSSNVIKFDYHMYMSRKGGYRPEHSTEYVGLRNFNFFFLVCCN
jgi:hypothetical protein